VCKANVDIDYVWMLLTLYQDYLEVYACVWRRYIVQYCSPVRQTLRFLRYIEIYLILYYCSIVYDAQYKYMGSVIVLKSTAVLVVVLYTIVVQLYWTTGKGIYIHTHSTT
jgi:hypothetical protein